MDFGGKPFGTGPGIFSCVEDRVFVVIAIPRAGVGQWIFVYNDERQSNSAYEELCNNLGAADAVAVRLKNEYSLDNLAVYLRQYLPKDGLIAVYRDALISFDGQRLTERVGDDLKSVHMEDVCSTSIDWQKKDTTIGESTVAGRFIADTFGLDQGFSYEARVTIRDSSGPIQLLNDVLLD